ncbi:hypothetical protein [Bifidobacterium biavatii]|uniref:Phage protein n=1 Tax=Bifidobacterium biavatii DSM 23969 TaxID=1437608 RepID=A0A086ZT95_9BIFI|nr:hypothetical protein [Bifidobacterium biavatii]KFI49745.1 phage protein [Bifidobacterium biavatii DSM 23969]
MAKVKVRLHSSGVLDVLNSAGVRNDIERRTEAITAAANRMHNAKGYVGDVIKTDRPHGAVRATTRYAKRSNAKHNTLLKSLDAGRN